MINMPVDQIKERISKKSGLSDAEVSAKIKDKLKQLSGLISEEGAAHIVANELGVKLFEVGENTQVKSILPGMRNVDMVAKVIQKYDLREFNGPKGPGKVQSMLVGDETGVIRVVLWNKKAEEAVQLKDGDVIKVVGGYVRENQGRNEVHMNDMSKIIINPKGVEVSVKPASGPKSFERKRINEITESDASVEILATIVQVFDINFFEVCPQCNKRARLREDGFVCQVHGTVKPDYGFVMNVIADDGSDNIRIVLWREQAEQLLGLSRDQILGFKEDPKKFEAMQHELLGNTVVFSGRASKNQTFDRIELVAARVNKAPNPAEEAKNLQPPKSAPTMPERQKQAPTAPAKDSAAPKDSDDMGEMNLEAELIDVDDL